MATPNEEAVTDSPAINLGTVPPKPLAYEGQERTPALFHAGTLRYTKTGLWLLFSWLLWGQFVYVMMEAVIPALLPLLLKTHKATNVEISFITSSLNVIGNMTFNPIVSFWSDRYRGRWGRRRPFIVYTTPLVVLFLMLIPFGPGIARYLSTVPIVGPFLELSPIVPSILMMAVFVMGFQVFDVFVGSVYYYLIRDTVPDEFLGRFNGLFRVVGSLAPLIFNWYIFGYSETHMKTVFVGISVFYGLGMLLMCWKVREGDFPPPEPLPPSPGRWYDRLWSSVRLYFGDCFRDRVYWMSFLALGVFHWSGLAAIFSVLFYRDELHIPLNTIGKLNGLNNILTMIVAVPLGYLIDRLNYVRITQLSACAQGLFCLLGFWLIRDGPTLLIFGLCYTVPKIAFLMAVSRSLMGIYPKAKYGQFSSAAAAFGAGGAIGMAVLAAKFVDLMGNYRSNLMWQGVLLIVSGILFIIVERRWRKLGGLHNYQAP